jgi:DNA-binding Lrp family transcriptional regulator
MQEPHTNAQLDLSDRRLINRLQHGLTVSERPYAEVAAALGMGEDEVLARLRGLLDAGILTRFGPLYNADRMGGAFTLAAMAVPESAFDQVADIVNASPEVAHNYRREHRLNMWFVLASEDPERIDEVIRNIEQSTGLQVHDFPKCEEFYVGLYLEA